MQLFVAPRGSSGGLDLGQRRMPGPMTEVVEEKADTFLRPISDPGGATREETWQATSIDGFWYYQRFEGDGTPWAVCYLPTGQTKETYPNLDDAREHTAGLLLAELRGEAFTAAFVPDDPQRRVAGQRLLAIHMRIAAQQPAFDLVVEANCVCGGLLTHATRTNLVHVDACAACWSAGTGITAPCGQSARHRFCADPAVAGLAFLARAILEFERKQWRRAGAKASAIREQFGVSEVRYYQRLNHLLGDPVAYAEYPGLVKRLQRLRRRRSSTRRPDRETF